jgi:hypothetical protein
MASWPVGPIHLPSVTNSHSTARGSMAARRERRKRPSARDGSLFGDWCCWLCVCVGEREREGEVILKKKEKKCRRHTYTRTTHTRENAPKGGAGTGGGLAAAAVADGGVGPCKNLLLRDHSPAPLALALFLAVFGGPGVCECGCVVCV